MTVSHSLGEDIEAITPASRRWFRPVRGGNTADRLLLTDDLKSERLVNLRSFYSILDRFDKSAHH
jgi:hypothetical protein